MRMRLGIDGLQDVMFSQAQPVMKLGRVKSTPGAFAEPTPDICAAAVSARARNSPVAASLEAQCAASKAVPAPAPANTNAGPCGVEPSFKMVPGPFGSRPKYDDAAAGGRYNDCLAAGQRASEMALLAAVNAGSAGGPDGCGGEFNGTYQDNNGKLLRDAQAACRARLLPPKPAPEAAPPVVHQAEIVESLPPREAAVPLYAKPAALPALPGGGGGGGGGASFDVRDVPASPADFGARGALEKTPVSASIDIPSELWIGLGILGAATVLGGIYIATRAPARSSGKKKRRPFSVAA